MKKTFRTTVAAALLLFFAAGCKPEKEPAPENLLDRETFTSLMLDVQLAEGIKSQYARSRAFGNDWSRDVYDDIFIRHNVAEEDFQKTFGWYQGRPDLMEGIYEQVLDSLSKLEAEIKQAYNNQAKAIRDSFPNKKSWLKEKYKKGGLNYMPDMSQYDTTSVDSTGPKKPL